MTEPLTPEKLREIRDSITTFNGAYLRAKRHPNLAPESLKTLASHIADLLCALDTADVRIAELEAFIQTGKPSHICEEGDCRKPKVKAWRWCDTHLQQALEEWKAEEHRKGRSIP